MNPQRHLLEAVRGGFRAAGTLEIPRILVVGDLMLDRYLWGEVERVSPEAPVPVVRLRHRTERFGGAANVAANLAGLGVETWVAGYLGDDEAGLRLTEMLADTGIHGGGLVRSASRPTITKTRVIGGRQQMLRLDQETTGAYPGAERGRLLGAVLERLEQAPIAALVLSDYAKGALDPELCQSLIGAARAKNIFVWVDPKGLDYRKYRGANAITPNLREAAQAVGEPAQDVAAVLERAGRLRRELGLDFIAVTRGEQGISLVEAEVTRHLPAQAREVFDVSGAGDTVIAGLAAGVAAGLSPLDACRLANHAAATVVAKVGTLPVDRAELLRAIEQAGIETQADKIRALPDLVRQAEHWRSQGETLVFTNGCFDLLHAGHVGYLEAAKRLGQRLVVGLNTDRSVAALKGPDRPVIHEADRARVLAALEAVDAVVVFDEDTPLALIQALRPDVLVKGDDYAEAEVVGAAEVKAAGGRVELIPVLAGRATSRIIARLVGQAA
ncbi:D-beta-D-heptose 7-phosphate kinase / D-beta-D-heptose 1-phosphate adenosyltransferase [Methylomagnum ishizawai]|uniref:Bifunctional protein HldE n=1 Tax=Methylomagnum ishizawai TaxID=1760988 RepID=A0A1Y6CXQ4_9GAMM|nr:D-glycero-beta-D-manno-heptose-7-phosphate kinase [Methylomagnum ishizawai]SMF93343.1 D-beta-D-heptose 7-phosphate kinase / D-beta-D-heptose 1-phosphate adenosyltransferase [Methylomagnum ishizawai]